MREVISTCPVCEHELSVTRLHCRECGTTLEGEFSVGRFSRLSRDQMRVLESFLRSRGNLREMERDLGLSYPTVRSRVDALVRSLGFVPLDSGRAADGETATEAASPISTERRRILESLARHEIDAEAAAIALRRLTAAPGSPSPAVVESAASATAASSATASSDPGQDQTQQPDVAQTDGEPVPIGEAAATEPDAGSADEAVDPTDGAGATDETAATERVADPTGTADDTTADPPTDKES
jgi:hypothetical protein